MSPHSDQTACEPFDALIEALVDGELEAADVLRVEAHLEGCAACREQADLALALRTELRALPQFDASAAVIERVLDVSRADQAAAREPWWRVSMPAPAWALAAAALLVAVLLPVLRTDPTVLDQPVVPDAVAEMDPVTIEQATLEARYALAHLSRASRRAGLEIRDGVLVERIVLPTAQGLLSVSTERAYQEVQPENET